MAYNALVLEQAIAVALGEACYPVEIEPVEGCAEVLALGKDGAPVQSRLKTLQAQLLEQAMVVAAREAPFGIMIGENAGAAPHHRKRDLPSGPNIVALICLPLD